MASSKIKVFYNCRWLGKINGLVLYPFVFFKPTRQAVSAKLVMHEAAHIMQVKRDGWFKFYLRYLWWSMKYGCWDNPYEVEARKREPK